MKSLDDLAAQCIRCGFCLDACPTFQLTGSELESPRGRIYLARTAQEGGIDWQAARPHLDRCLGCLACEPACPSGVRYGELLELARAAIDADSGLRRRAASRAVVGAASSGALLRLARPLAGRRIPGAASRFIAGAEAQVDLPVREAAVLPPLVEAELPPVRSEAYLLEGCAMRELFPRVHECLRRLLRRTGVAVRPGAVGCCGSMHAHLGLLDEATERARRLAATAVDELPIVVDSAGCGSAMKRYGELFEGGERVAARTFDAAEFLFDQGLAASLARAPGFDSPARIAVHDACHLAHGQGIRAAPRELLAAIPGVELVPLAESDMCCGSAGVYNLVQPRLARELLERKLDNVASSGARIVALGNPGCHAWMAQGQRERAAADRPTARVFHTVEVLEAAFIGLEAFGFDPAAAQAERSGG